MSGLTTEQITWAKGFVGFDIPVPEGDAPGSSGHAPENGTGDPAANGATGASAAEGEGTKPIPRSKGFLDRFRKAKKPEATSTEPEGVAPKDEALAKALKTLSDEIAAMQKFGFDTARMKEDAADLAKHGVKAEAETDTGKREKALAALRTRADEQIKHVQALSKSLKDVMGKSKGNPTDDQKSKIYEKALKDYYGQEIVVPNGMKNTHFDKMFDMFGTVPKGDVKQDKLKKLEYVKTDTGGVYYEDDCKIEMGNFGKADKEEDYELNGKKVPANSFNVTALHEIGHAVDAKHTIMDSNQSKPGAGGWESQKLTDVAAAFVAELKNTVKPTDKVTDPMLTQVVTTALKDGTTVQLGAIGNDDWQKILPFLVSHCLPCRDKAEPYFKNSPVVVGTKVYTEASPGEWWSYASSARAATRVNDYQWRSPAEWFAEVYAITWLKKKPPPSGVDSAIAEYCWKE